MSSKKRGAVRKLLEQLKVIRDAAGLSLEDAADLFDAIAAAADTEPQQQPSSVQWPDTTGPKGVQ